MNTQQRAKVRAVSGDLAAAFTYGSYVCLSIFINDRFYGSSYSLGWMHEATHMDSVSLLTKPIQS